MWVQRNNGAESKETGKQSRTISNCFPSKEWTRTIVLANLLAYLDRVGSRV
jgi:hypothetical protein